MEASLESDEASALQQILMERFPDGATKEEIASFLAMMVRPPRRLLLALALSLTKLFLQSRRNTLKEGLDLMASLVSFGENQGTEGRDRGDSDTSSVSDTEAPGRSRSRGRTHSIVDFFEPVDENEPVETPVERPTLTRAS